MYEDTRVTFTALYLLFDVLNSRNSNIASLFTGVTVTVSFPVVVYADIIYLVHYLMTFW